MTHTKHTMPKPEEIRAVYFIGIGGIGMSALARYFNHLGARVTGYDKTPSALTRQLEQEGIAVHYEENLDRIDRDATVVVYTPAVPAEHRELNYFRDNDYNVVKRSDLLSLVTKSSSCICVAGTHGKTTTSCLIAHILRDAAVGCNALLGGISVNYDTNFWYESGKATVTEADEYDRSFLKLNPDVAVITSMDADHLDIYGTESAMQDAFVEFSGKIKEGGLLVCRKGIAREAQLKGSRKITYSVEDNTADAYVENITVKNGEYFFDVVINGKRMDGFSITMGGRHNIENALAAIVVADQLTISEASIRKAVASFRGVKRRFEFVLKTEGNILIDDYAHHPEELRALLQGVRELYPGKKLTIVFQPHLYTRTRDLVDGFAAELSASDEILLLPVYPARELPIAGVDSQMIAEKIKGKQVAVVDKEMFLAKVKAEKPELLVMAGAGDIDALVEPVKSILINK